jgi:tetratricopeptide (TPR) repeat protein
MKKLFLAFFVGLFFCGVASADDSSDQVYGDGAKSSTLSESERLTVLERQMANLNQQNSTEQIQALQEQLANVKGRMEVLEHSFEQLNEQVKQQYQDFDARLHNTATTTHEKTSNSSSDDTDQNAKKAAKLASNEQAMESPTDDNNKLSSAKDIKAEELAYQKALGLLKAKDYPRVTPSLQNLLSKYPHGKNAANAHFWLGEIYLLQGQPDTALSEYRKVLTNFPTSDKVPMAQLKTGFAYQDQGGTAKARAQYQKVIKLYPGSNTAKLAMQKLSELSTAAKKKSGNKENG